MREQRVILGLPWLRTVNLIINWPSGKVQISNNIRLLKQTDFEEEIENDSVYAYYAATENISARIILAAYLEYTNVFNEEAKSKLPPYRDYLNHAIDLQPGVTPSFDLLYNLSEIELTVLKDYIK